MKLKVNLHPIQSASTSCSEMVTRCSYTKIPKNELNPLDNNVIGLSR